MASDKQASDILLLDIRELTAFADYMVIMSAETTPQMDALAEDLRLSLKAEGETLYHQEGTPASGWLLLDFADVVVHIFAPEQREYYKLEQVWNKARPVVRIQ